MKWKPIIKILVPFLVLAFTVPLLLWLLLTGPQDLSLFPQPEDSPYFLPYPKGRSYFCVQGVRGVVSHRGTGRFAYDFLMPVGSPVCAAREGVVSRVVDEHDGHGYKHPNNLIAVTHEDGTIACYAHICKGGARVHVGESVKVGAHIADSGHVGHSMMPHLHFHVYDPSVKETVPVSFRDVNKHRGVPRMFRWYQSVEEGT
ncbi:MAG: M23 family metallopeptidase [Candidatus Hydrogenedentes bacterium]|jgi:murein DD-endopeptidase MepM/ murein hydrolase activator NlpD|nr:M23 family metallopeptidase [Candidatus Hydrogenedentota bacterium]